MVSWHRLQAGHADCWAGDYEQNSAAILEFIGWELPEQVRTPAGPSTLPAGAGEKAGAIQVGGDEGGGSGGADSGVAAAGVISGGGGIANGAAGAPAEAVDT